MIKAPNALALGVSEYYGGQLPGRQAERLCGSFPPLNMVGLPDPVYPLAPLPSSNSAERTRAPHCDFTSRHGRAEGRPGGEVEPVRPGVGINTFHGYLCHVSPGVIECIMSAGCGMLPLALPLNRLHRITRDMSAGLSPIIRDGASVRYDSFRNSAAWSVGINSISAGVPEMFAVSLMAVGPVEPFLEIRLR